MAILQPNQSAVAKVAPEFTGRPSRMHAAWADINQGLLQWRVWWVLALIEVRQRYRRSSLGQLWLTLSMAATIAGIGITFGVIFNQRFDSYIPFLGVGLIVWALISGLINDLATAFIVSDTYLGAYPGPRSVVIFRAIARNCVAAAHNLLIVPLLLFFFSIPITWAIFLFVPGVVLVLLNAVWVGMLVGPLGTRFRDLPQLIANVVQLAFFVTPIMYRPAQIQDRLWLLTHFNPLASFVEILRAPLLGNVPSLHHYGLVLLVTFVGFAVAIPFYARFRERIVYWL